MHVRRVGAALVATAAALGGSVSLAPQALAAEPAQHFHVTLDQLNGSGASGVVNLRVKHDLVHVVVNMRGLLPGQVHMQHLHWDAAATHTCPPPSAAGADGVLTVAEGLPSYGQVDIPLVDAQGNYPVARHNGTYHFERTFALTEAQEEHAADWVVVVHGIDRNGTGGYDLADEMTDPAACGPVG